MLRGDRLKQLRENKGITHSELADHLQVGFAQIYRFESGKADPSTEVLDRMANLFDVSVDYLLGRIDTPYPELESLSSEEKEVISAWRRGDYRTAMRVMVGE